MDYIAYCGLLCNECPIYIATQNNDVQAKEKLAVECSNENFTFTAEDMTCQGCFWDKNDSTKMCGDCEIRKCAKDKGAHNCGHCCEYPCEIVERRVPEDSQNRVRLDTIYNSRS
ncbi:MAG: DUF3795 domain-containing protein [Bacillota bacterium]|nr:DUF3795 domain-containing protein [Bacillota bacterium]